MDRHMVAASAHCADTFRVSLREAQNFETVFQTPATHFLLVVRSRSRGGDSSVRYTGSARSMMPAGG